MSAQTASVRPLGYVPRAGAESCDDGKAKTRTGVRDNDATTTTTSATTDPTMDIEGSTPPMCPLSDETTLQDVLDQARRSDAPGQPGPSQTAPHDPQGSQTRPSDHQGLPRDSSEGPCGPSMESQPRAAWETNGDGEECGESGVRTAQSPTTPSQQMVDDHEARGHIPHRTWCKACMDGRMRGERHPEHGDEQATLPHISMD